MPIRVISVGDDARDPLVVLALDYLARTSKNLSPKHYVVKEGKRKSKSGLSAIEKTEGQALLEASKGCFRIALDADGKQQDSIAFAKRLNTLLVRSNEIALLIGGASGLSKDVVEQCDEIWSLSSMTLPHRLALLVLAEQIYRAGEILRGGPYHK